MRDATIYVDCSRDGKVIRTYDFLVPATLAGPPVPPIDASFIDEAKGNLAAERLADYPYVGITFRVRRS